MVMVIFFWDCTFPSILHVGELIDFMPLMAHFGMAGCLVRALLEIVWHMILARGPDTVKVTKVTKVKGHATEADVEQGQVRLEDWLGNIEADAAADLGRRHQHEELMGARWALLQARELWYPIMLQIHRLMGLS